MVNDKDRQSVAQRIQSLIHTLPPPEHQYDPVKEDTLLSLLKSTSVMSGASGIFSILDRMKSPSLNEDDIFSDSSSVMLYSPLLPSTSSLVELADTDVVEEEYEEPVPDPEPAPPIPGWSWSNVVSPIAAWINPVHGPLTPRSRERHLRTTKVWIPSKEKLSIQAMWWGYRLFLPPPILDVLDDKQLEAARRASMITTALTWFFNNLPISTFPLPMQPILLLIQRIAPYLGYIGTFVSWSWTSVKSYDQGFGVILTATWLLPIALIPGTWQQRDWPITPPTFTSPLPPEHLPSSDQLSPPAHIPTPVTPLPPSVSMLPNDLPPSSPSELSYATAPTSPIPTISSTPYSNIPVLLSPYVASSSLHPTPSSPHIPSTSPSTSSLPKRLQVSLAGLVAKTPTIRSHRISSPPIISSPLATSTPITSNPNSPLASPPIMPHPTFSLNGSITDQSTISNEPVHTYPYPSPTSINDNTNDHYYHYSNQYQYPSPPADPNDLSLLQSPFVPCSPLPDEGTIPDRKKGKGKRKLRNLLKSSR